MSRPANLFRPVVMLGVILSTLLSLPTFAAGNALSAHQPWVQAGPPVAKVLAGYLELRNSGDKPLVITGAYSPVFRLVEIHRSEMHNGMMRMIRVPRLAVPAHGKITLAPGGYHLMLIDPKKPLMPGDSIKMTFILDSGKTFDVTMPVRKSESGGMMMHDHDMVHDQMHDHDNMMHSQ